jgi:UDP-glucose 4-epimerase
LKVLVTGGAGFIGGHVVQALVSADCTVGIVDDLSSGSTDDVAAACRKGLRSQDVFLADITGPDLAAIVDAWRPDVIAHLAAQALVRESVRNPHRDARVNILGTLNVLDAAASAGAIRVVLASSGGAVYGDLAAPALAMGEEATRRPLSPYGVSKMSADAYARVYRDLYQLDVVSLLLGNVYGTRAGHGLGSGVITAFVDALAAGRTPVVYGNGEQLRDYVHVRDVARAFARACRAGTGGTQFINVASGTGRSVSEILVLVCAEFGVPATAEHLPAQPGEVFKICLDVRRAREVLDWQPTVELVDGIREMVEWARAEHALGPSWLTPVNVSSAEG